MPKRLVPVMSLIAAVILLVMLNWTTPAGVGPLGVLVFFTTFYILMFGIAFWLVKIATQIMGKRVGRKTALYAAVVAFGPIMLLLAQSLGTMNPMTIVLAVVFVFLGCLLISKRTQVR